MRSQACLSLFESGSCRGLQKLAEGCELREPPQTWPLTKLMPGAANELLNRGSKNTETGWVSNV